ncbi:hypothetical protein SAMN05216349_1832 [Oribacterium sp. KHPX15]|uniref:hypothetical protein n=1 Tax=Oribacterium sp. KHPX15 TaxID=1855342 RepID=UPI00089A32C3|nr:hypothetical protein [Oribacterium sp. KHPX15]SEA97656.1 hypothetical protein SAMN05216349_1832 [Oribacterium sp. KHPX15]
MNTYEAYLKHEAGNIITIEECMKIYSALVESISSCTVEDKLDFWNEFINRAARYAYIRNQWETMSIEEKTSADDGRSKAHNVVIISLNTLARIVEGDGGDASWRAQLGNERKRIGDFACFVSYITGISNR